MSTVLDLLLAGSRIATGFGVALIAVSLAALVWLAMRAFGRPGPDSAHDAAAILEASAVQRHRRRVHRPARVVRHVAVDEPTRVLPVLRDQTELIPRVGGGRRG